MFKQAILALIGGLMVLTIFPTPVAAVSPCAATNIRWSLSSNSVYLTGDVACTLTDIKQLGSKYIPLTLVDSTNQVWFLGANLFLQQGAKLILHGSLVGGDVNELRLKSNNLNSNDFIKISTDWGTIDIDSTKITSWDVNAGGPDLEYAQYRRAYIQARSRLDPDGVTPRESRLDIKNSELGYLGYNGSEAYGLSWKVVAGGFETVGVLGDVVNNLIHDNYFGLYTYGAEAMTFRDNEIYQNIKYGLDPHDDSDYLIIDNNFIHDNGSHGLICSQRCNNLTITNNISTNNVGNGIMLHRNVVDSLVEGNTVNDNLDSGVAIFDSHNNTIRDNEAKRNKNGIRLSVGSADNLIENNNFSDNTKYGLYFYKGSDAPTSGDGRVKLNTFRDNIVNANGSVAAKIQQSDTNTFTNNEFTGNSSYAFEIQDADSNVFEQNSLTGNIYNYYYAKSDAVNTIQDSDAFAVKIGDTLSSMTITNSNQDIYQNSKNIPTTVSPSNSTIILNRTNASSAIVSFNRLNFTVMPVADSLIIKPLIWNTGGDYSKKWTASNGLSSTTTATYVVGNLAQNTGYDVMVNGTSWNSVVANDNGEITFDYSGVFQNLKTFEVKASL